MIKREYFVVIKDFNTDSIRSIESRCDSIDNAKLFMAENASLIINLNKNPINKNKEYRFDIQEVVVIEGK